MTIIREVDKRCQTNKHLSGMSDAHINYTLKSYQSNRKLLESIIGGKISFEKGDREFFSMKKLKFIQKNREFRSIIYRSFKYTEL